MRINIQTKIKTCVGHSLIEALLALVLISNAWIGVETLLHSNTAKIFSYQDKIKHILRQMSLSEDACQNFPCSYP